MQRDAVRTLGFLGVTLVPMTASHLSRQATVGAALQALVTSLILALAFHLGARLSTAVLGTLGRPVRRELAAGLGGGLVLWTGLWVFWTLAPSDWADRIGWALFPAYLALSLACGGATGLSRPRLGEPV